MPIDALNPGQVATSSRDLRQHSNRQPETMSAQCRRCRWRGVGTRPRSIVEPQADMQSVTGFRRHMQSFGSASIHNLNRAVCNILSE